MPVTATVGQEESGVTSRIRGIVRRAGVGAGVLALALGAAACTGGDDEQSEAPGTTPAAGQEPSEESGAAPAPSDGGAATDAGPFSDEELEQASARFVEGLQLLDDQDWEGACGLVLDPSTGAAPEGERLQECVDGVGPAVAAYADVLEPGTFDVIDPSMAQATDDGDGTVSLSLLDEPVDVPMVRADGEWYFSIPF